MKLKNDKWIWVECFKGGDKGMSGIHIVNNNEKNNEDFFVCRYPEDAYDYYDPIEGMKVYYRLSALVKKSDWDDMWKFSHKSNNPKHIRKKFCIAKCIHYLDEINDKDNLNEWIRHSKYKNIPQKTIFRLRKELE